jgi:hypothetical protein
MRIWSLQKPARVRCAFIWGLQRQALLLRGSLPCPGHSRRGPRSP